MNWLKEVAKFHADYLRIVQSYGEDFYAEDIVQEMYIRLHKYADREKVIQKNGTLNRAYIHFTLRNIFKDLTKERNKHQMVNIEERKDIGVTYDYISKEEAFSCLIKRVKEEAENWHWYDEMLFKHYFDSGMSMRELADETRISTSSIFQTIKYCKGKLKENLNEDYEDYKNEDYELI